MLEFGREREGIDKSKLILTHHNISNRGVEAMSPGSGDKLQPITEAGSGSVREKETVYMSNLIDKLNELFGSDTIDQDQLVYVNDVLLGKLLESRMLQQRATSNTKEEFSNSPHLGSALTNASSVRQGLKDILLNCSRLWEALRSISARKASESVATIDPQ